MGRSVTLRELHTGGDYDLDSRVQSVECDLCNGGHLHIRCDCPDEMTGYIVEPDVGAQEVSCPHCGLVVVVSEDDARWFQEHVNVY